MSSAYTRLLTALEGCLAIASARTFEVVRGARLASLAAEADGLGRALRRSIKDASSGNVRIRRRVREVHPRWTR